ncbi:MAG: hypothetical protein P8018_13780 [Acidobacteriota bacterium]|jgi:hypothetical protein
MLADHMLSLLIFSFLVALFFATVLHRDRKSFIKSVLKTMGWMVLGALAFAWLMLWTAK